MSNTAFDNGGFDYVTFVNEGFEAQTKYAKKAGDAFTPEDLKRIDELLAVGGFNSDVKEKFADALEFRYAKIIEHFGHLLEEMVEARVYVPRRSWKNEEVSFLDYPRLRKEFIAEVFDVLLFHRAILAYAGVTGEEFAKVAAEKMEYNSKRPDHNVNSDAKAERDPAAELQGNCPSANFAQ